MKNNRGFTLIELTILIIISSILSAFAVPKFLSLKDDAKSSMFKGVKGALFSGSNIAHSKLLVDGHNVTIKALVLDHLNADNNWCEPQSPEVFCSFAYGSPSSRGTIKSVVSSLRGEWNINLSGGYKKSFKIYLKEDADTTGDEEKYSDFPPKSDACYIDYVIDYTPEIEFSERISIEIKNC